MKFLISSVHGARRVGRRRWHTFDKTEIAIFCKIYGEHVIINCTRCRFDNYTGQNTRMKYNHRVHGVIFWLWDDSIRRRGVHDALEHEFIRSVE